MTVTEAVRLLSSVRQRQRAERRAGTGPEGSRVCLVGGVISGPSVPTAGGGGITLAGAPELGDDSM